MPYGVSMASIFYSTRTLWLRAPAARVHSYLQGSYLILYIVTLHEPRPPAPARVTLKKGIKCSKGTTQHVVYRSMHMAHHAMDMSR